MHVSARLPSLLRCATIAALALAAAPSVAAAQWRSEPVPGEWYLSPLDLAFDRAGRGLFSWEGAQPRAPRKFTALDVRAPTGGWTRAPNLAKITWGGARIHLYGATRALLVANQVSSLGEFNRARWRLVYAYGRSNGTFGSLRRLAEHVAGGSSRSAANARGEALVTWSDDRSFATQVRERPAGGSFGATRTLRATGIGTAAMNARGDRVVAWWERGGVRARVRRHGRPWGAPMLAAAAPFITNAQVRAAITPGGRVVLAWQSVDVREGAPVTLRAGVAYVDRGRRWRSARLEKSTVTSGSLTSSDAPARVVVDAAGRVHVAWTGTSGGAPVVKVARVVHGGPQPPTVLSSGVPGATLDDASAAPDGSLLVSWSTSDRGASTAYASLRRPGGPFLAPERLTPAGVTGFGQSRTAFAPLTGEPVVIWGSVDPATGGTPHAAIGPAR